jgi:hypothetical protein
MKQITVQHSQERYENIFNMYEVENENTDRYVFYNITNKVSLPQNLDDSVFDYWTVPGLMPLTTISYKIYNTQHLWWLIMVSNGLKNPVKLFTPGTVIKTIKKEYLNQIFKSISQK